MANLSDLFLRDKGTKVKRTKVKSIKPSSEVDFHEQSTRQVFVNYKVFKISGNSNGGHVRKRKKNKNFIPFYILLSFLVCINTDSNVQTGATLF